MGYLENILSKRKLKIGLRAGHSPNCLGAIGLRNEHYTMKTYYQYVKECFEYYGHTVIDCNSNASSERAEVYEGINKANANKQAEDQYMKNWEKENLDENGNYVAPTYEDKQMESQMPENVQMEEQEEGITLY